MNVLYAQLIGACAIAVIVLSVQFKTKKNIMIFQCIANLLYSFQYLFLNAFSASSLNIVTAIRCLCFYKYDKNQKRIPTFFIFIFILIILFVGFLNYRNLLDIIPIFISIIYTIFSASKNPNKFRKAFMFCSFIWIFYNFINQAYVSAFGNICEIISSLNALSRYNDK